MRRWPVNAWSQYSDVPVANNTVMDLVALPGGGLLFAAGDPAWGVLNAAGQIQSRQDGAIADLRGPDQLRLSADGRRVRFGYQWPGQDARSFDLVNRSLGADDSALSAARTAAPGLDIKNWQDRTDPTLNGQPLKLEQYERSRSLAIAPDAERFVLGTEWSLRLFDRAGRELWQQPVPGIAWAVNISADGRFVVAGYGDGTIRWHRLSNGEEVLALFPHADRQRWIAWTPEGFYATSGPDAEELVGYHLNRGKEREGEFISARQLREHFYQPGLISQRLDANGDALVAEAVQKLGDVRELLAGAKAPSAGRGVALGCPDHDRWRRPGQGPHQGSRRGYWAADLPHRWHRVRRSPGGNRRRRYRQPNLHLTAATRAARNHGERDQCPGRGILAGAHRGTGTATTVGCPVFACARHRRFSLP